MRQTWTEKGLKYPEHRENDIIVVEQKNAQYFYFRTFQETREKKHTHTFLKLILRVRSINVTFGLKYNTLKAKQGE